MKIMKLLTTNAGTYIVTITSIHSEWVREHTGSEGLDDRVHRVEHPERDAHPNERDRSFRRRCEMHGPKAMATLTPMAAGTSAAQRTNVR
jgi:hypothetical protein